MLEDKRANSLRRHAAPLVMSITHSDPYHHHKDHQHRHTRKLTASQYYSTKQKAEKNKW
jgi:hypothetical protein